MMESVKIMVVGDGAVGKTCMLISYTSNSFPKEYVPTVFDNYSANIRVADTTVSLSLWDTAGPEDYDRLRPLSYPHTNVFFVCYSVVSRTSFRNVSSKWIPEISVHIPLVAPDAAIFLIGTKMDLRENPDMIHSLSEKGLAPVPTEEGEKLAKELNLDGFHENSALTLKNLKETFDDAIYFDLHKREFLHPKLPPQPKLDLSFKSEDKIFSTIRKEISQSFGLKKYSDVRIICGDGTTFFCHKIILACGSDIFHSFLVEGGSPPTCFSNLPVQKVEAAKKSKKTKMQIESFVRTTKDVTHLDSIGRYAFVCFVDTNFLYVVGGGDKGSGCVEDMLKINLNTREIQVVEYKSSGTDQKLYPVGSFQSAVKLRNGTALVFGGKANGYSRNLWQFHCDEGTWTKIEYTGTIPPARYGHSASLSNNGKTMYMFGGYDNQIGLSNDLYQYDIQSRSWSLVKPQGNRPPCRYGHISAVLKGSSKKPDQFVVIGGRGDQIVFNDIWIFDSESKQWREIQVKRKGPTGRYGFASFVHGQEIFVFGGFDGKVVYNDTWALNLKQTDNCEWRPLSSGSGKQASAYTTQPGDFLARYHHAVMFDPVNGIFIFGGRNEDHSLCLWTESGDVKSTAVKPQMQLHFSQIKEIHMQPKIESREVANWLKSIYSGTPDRMRLFVEQYGEVISLDHIFQKKIGDFAVGPNCLFSDIEIKTSDSKTVKAHKVLLNSNSGFFQALFENEAEMGPLSELPIEMTSFDFQILQIFLYGRKNNITVSNALYLYEIANKNLIGGLEDLIESFIFAHIDQFDPFQLLLHANKFYSKNLQILATWYLIVNFEKYEKSNSWDSLPSEQRNHIQKNQWPGQDYLKELKAYHIRVKEGRKREKENCVLQ